MDDVVKGWEVLCTLDEETCLECLLLDGQSKPKRFPVHAGCRCTLVPVLKSWKELGIDLKESPPSTRSSALGQLAEDGGIYKQYLIERARGDQAKVEPSALAMNLRAWLSAATLQSRTDPRVLRHIAASIIETDPSVDFQEIRSLLSSSEWNDDYVVRFLEYCAAAGQFEFMHEVLEALVGKVPIQENRHHYQSRLFYWVGSACKRHSIPEALALMRRATTLWPDDPAALMELAALLRRSKLYSEAKETIDRALAVNPTSRAAINERDRIVRKLQAGTP